ncbi:glycosyltransferase N-terminal domain-containing protein [Hyphomicrobium sp. LHD-15]|uniref:glycosyltransferase N-terminal domain-containing protein n=1 Tax=Hyphomicrobium sp. LHD-15 TaxID=3072142 RepID=UPI00280F7EEB|nr:glycosyltransferase N-terminal domain-containing protein [Hyphomicrobium sp. LHD-15]MDQ8700469.1 glycosyltransferase N-terminal domain-containing protein [Hyphomicrobium sp. LHD-15]
MAQSPRQESRLGRFAGKLGARYTRFVRSSSTVVLEPPDAKERVFAVHPFILAMWHGQFILQPTLHEGAFKVSAIAARHGDATLIRVLLGEFDIDVVQGAGAQGRKRDRGGATALRTAVRLLKGGSTFSMTADIPPGPARIAGTGIVTIARYAGRPIVPFAVATSRFFVLPTWSRMTINLPFSKIAYVIGDPIWVPADADETVLEERRLEVEVALNRVTERAYSLVGADVARVTPPSASAPPTEPVQEGLTLKTYRAGTRVFGFAAPLLLALRSWQGKEDSSRRGERYGKAGLPRPDGPLVWVHAASVGETNAVLPVIERLLAEREDLSVLLTTGTLTSAALAKRRLGPRAFHQYIALDVPEYVRTFLDYWKPDLAVFAESEIWPNLILESSRRSIPIALVNARMSGRSARRWKRLKGISLPLFSRFDVVLAQNELLARSFKGLGARGVQAVGNLKIDAPPPLVDADELDRLRQALGNRPVLVAASTHDPEEEIVARAHGLIAKRLPGFCTIIAPRHPQRGKAVADMIAAKGFKVKLRSAGELPDSETDIYVADTIGELGTFYALSKVAFVGGSLIAHGGQNPVEAIGHGAVVLTGPHWTNFRDLYRALLRRKGVREVTSAEELAEAAEQILTQDDELQRMRGGAKLALSALAGALDRTVSALLEMLPQSRVRRAS